jgi:hypothetical protein
MRFDDLFELFNPDPHGPNGAFHTIGVALFPDLGNKRRSRKCQPEAEDIELTPVLAAHMTIEMAP